MYTALLPHGPITTKVYLTGMMEADEAGRRRDSRLQVRHVMSDRNRVVVALGVPQIARRWERE